MTEFLKKVWQAILKFSSFIFKKLFQTWIKDLVKEVIPEIPVTDQKMVMFENSCYDIDISIGECVRDNILIYLNSITKDCEMTPELKKLFLLISTVSTKVLTPIKDDLLEQFNDMFNRPTSELPDED